MISLAVFLVLIFLFSLVSRGAERIGLTGPVVFTIGGILVFFAQPNTVALEITNPFILLVAEITLVVVLFSDATRLNLRKVMRETLIPARLLAIGMPLTMVAGTLTALLLFTNASLWEAAILATILAPTDASLAATVVKSKLVPARIRQALEVEGGLNDGIATPFLILFIMLSGIALHDQDQSWLTFAVRQVGFGVVGGVVVGLLGGWLMTRAERRNLITADAKQLALLALAVLSWGLTDHLLGGNGFIAAFVAGSFLHLSYDTARAQMAEFDEAWRDLLVYFVFFAFGLMAGRALPNMSGIIWLYALLSLTVVRMLPVALSLIGTRLQPATVLFMGWFGPRGLASVVLGMVYLEEVTDISANSTIVRAMAATVLLSVLAHGISANPLIKLFSGRLTNLEPDAPEYEKPVVPYS